MNRQKDDAWKEARRRCRLNDEDIGMAKKLGFQPKSLIKNIPAPSQRWKAPVKQWVRSLYEEKFGSPGPVAHPAATSPPPPSKRPLPRIEPPQIAAKRSIPISGIGDDDVPF